MAFGWMDRQTDGQRLITIAHSELVAQANKNVNILGKK